MARKMSKNRQRDRFYIFTNGKGSEMNYFALLGKRQTLYRVIPVFVNGDPLSLVEEAARHIHEANQIWCVFDIDQFAADSILKAMIMARRSKKINVVCSNRSFEVWLISHFRLCSGNKGKDDLEKEIEDYVKKERNLAKYEYDKADAELLKRHFLPHIEEAVTNSKIVYQRKTVLFPSKVDGFYPVWKNEWNSSTSVFSLVEALFFDGGKSRHD